MSALDRLLSLRTLPRGWHFGEGEPIEAHVILFGVAALQAFEERGYSATDSFPGIDGDLRVTGYWGNTYVEFDVDEQGANFVVRIEHAGRERTLYSGEDFYQAVSVIPRRHRHQTAGLPQLVIQRRELRANLPWMVRRWSLSESSTFDITIRGLGAFKVGRLSPKAAFPSSTTNAPGQLPPQPANTSPSSIPL